MTYVEQILYIAKKFNGMITATQVTEAKIPRRCLTECVNKELLYKASRGVYVLPDVWEDEMFILQYKYPKGIFSYETALYLHGLTDRTPLSYTMTFPKGYNITAAKTNRVAAKIVNVENYELGLIEMQSPCKNKIRVYDVERTLCDIVKGNNACDIQIVNSAMKNYIRLKDKNINKLFEYATQIKVKSQIAHYMEVLL
ncbi:MAG TPA: abortive phage infection protein [Lachnospiraceae bacterium]|jgi:predicted transcriptional regulator of viral defense system|nr:abortive phage infection protein [Lachnospiraceae bacterium]